MRKLGSIDVKNRDHATSKIDESVKSGQRLSGEATLYIALPDISLTVENSRKIDLSVQDCISIITKQFGDNYDVLSLPKSASDFTYLEEFLKGPKPKRDKAQKFFEEIVEFAKAFVNEDKSAARIPAINLIRDNSNNKLYIVAGNRRYYGRCIARFETIECHKIKDKDNFKSSELIRSNLNENTGQAPLSFNEKFDTLRSLIRKLSEEESKPIHKFTRQEFAEKSGQTINQIKHYWPVLIEDDFVGDLIAGEAINGRAMLTDFLKLNRDEQIQFVMNSDYPELVSVFPGAIAIEKPVTEKVKKTLKAKSFSLPRIKDPAMGHAILSALLKLPEFESFKNEKLGRKKIPKEISEQAILINEMFGETTQEIENA
jgi:hypothetical protein